MEGKHIDNIEYIVGSQIGREIKIVFADIEPQLDGYSCARISIEWDSDLTETSIYVISENPVLKRVKHWQTVCPHKALAYVFTNIE